MLKILPIGQMQDVPRGEIEMLKRHASGEILQIIV
jgi:hypothetical protein